MMPIPGGWIIAIDGYEIGRGSLAECVEAGREHGAVEVDIAMGNRGEPVQRMRVVRRGVVIVPVGRGVRDRRAR